MTTYSKYNDYTLCETGEVEGGGTLSRYFNFASATITTIFREKAEKNIEKYAGSNAGTRIATAVALSSQMDVKKFSELDSLAEVTILHKKLVDLEGSPPPLEDILSAAAVTGKDIKVSRPLQLKS